MGIIETMKRNASYKDSDVYRPGAFNPGLFDLNKKIPAEKWAYVEALARQYMANHPGMARNGLGYPYADAEPIEGIKFNPRITLDRF